MDRLDAIKIFVRVVESGGSFTAVARELGVGQPTVSKQIAALEEHLGAQLLMRTSRRNSLTEAGRDFFESAARTIGELEAAESRIGRGVRSPAGRVRVAVAPGFGELFVVPRLPAFFKRYPDVTLDIWVSERPANLVEDGIDVAIRNGAMVESSLVAPRETASSVKADKKGSHHETARQQGCDSDRRFKRHRSGHCKSLRRGSRGGGCELCARS